MIGELPRSVQQRAVAADHHCEVAVRGQFLDRQAGPELEEGRRPLVGQEYKLAGIEHLVQKLQRRCQVTGGVGLGATSRLYTRFGTGLVDFDNDGYLDVFVANGNAHHEYTEEDVLMLPGFDPDRDFVLYYTVSPEDVGLNLLSYKPGGGSDGFFVIVEPACDAALSGAHRVGAEVQVGAAFGQALDRAFELFAEFSALWLKHFSFPLSDGRQHRVRPGGG